MIIKRHFTSLQKGPGFQSHWSPLLSHPSVSATDKEELNEERDQIESIANRDMSDISVKSDSSFEDAKYK